MQAEPDALSDKLKPALVPLAALAALLLIGWPLSGLLNLFLGRERTVTAQLGKSEVEVGVRNNTVTTTFESNGKTYRLQTRSGPPIQPGTPAELVVDGLFWDEVVEIRQGGKTVWKRI